MGYVAHSEMLPSLTASITESVEEREDGGRYQRGSEIKQSCVVFLLLPSSTLLLGDRGPVEP